ncbi:hypothetical protein [Amycolatopsis sp. NBC_01480]|uniref:hypothetical protein n=1 Tax=Amycolatopsis sp. NBC_01480 TaxID=2903562 RepID=UPI002E2BDFEE|nr:hypothetical protein [Amycolatopsis sp. NBC_01480]
MSNSGLAAVLDAPRMAIGSTYGYMRVPCNVPDRKVCRLENQVVRYAKARGLYFVRFFSEFNCGSREAFEELVVELIHTDSHHVVVPSLRHLSHNALLQDLMLDRLSFTAHADVYAVHLKSKFE